MSVDIIFQRIELPLNGRAKLLVHDGKPLKRLYKVEPPLYPELKHGENESLSDA